MLYDTYTLNITNFQNKIINGKYVGSIMSSWISWKQIKDIKKVRKGK